MRTKVAPEADDIPATFLKALGPTARQELPGIFNFNFITLPMESTITRTTHLATASPGSDALSPPGSVGQVLNRQA